MAKYDILFHAKFSYIRKSTRVYAHTLYMKREKKIKI